MTLFEFSEKHPILYNGVIAAAILLMLVLGSWVAPGFIKVACMIAVTVLVAQFRGCKTWRKAEEDRRRRQYDHIIETGSARPQPGDWSGLTTGCGLLAIFALMYGAEALGKWLR